MPRREAAMPPTIGPTATLRSCAPCTRAIATGTLSRGAEVLASAIVIGVKPAKNPMIRRAAKSCWTDVTTHRGDDEREADERADQHHLSAEAIGEPSEDGGQ